MASRRDQRPRDLAPLAHAKRARPSRRQRRLATALTIEDLRTMARRRTPKAAFDYTDGAADAELSLMRAREAFKEIELHPRVLRDMSTVDPSVEVLGRRSALPFGIAPTGFTRLMHAEGEIAGAQAAGRAGIPYTLSTLGTTSIEEIQAANPDGRKWFQLYMWRDRDWAQSLIERADRAGFDTLVVTVDAPVSGERLRDIRNGRAIPPRWNLRTLFDAVPRPRWWLDLLTSDPISCVSLAGRSVAPADQPDPMFDPTVTYQDLAWVKQQWPGRLVVKGVQTVEDARQLASLGVDGIVLSNHGGRQLDRAVVPFHLLPHVVREVGNDVEILLDSGIMHGADIVAALALGARFTLIGRAYLYGLMAGGRDGVDRSIEILSSQVQRTMRLLGARDVRELEPGHVTQLRRLVPANMVSLNSLV